MTPKIVLTFVLVALPALFGQEDSDYQGLMKTIATANQSLQKNLATKNSAAIVTDAQKLQDTFKVVEEFWQKRNVSDAADFAHKAQLAASSISQSAIAEKIDQAAIDAKTLSATCAGCHIAHREKTDAGFKIK